jgi:DNA-binding transcriptional ArsR family regulator
MQDDAAGRVSEMRATAHPVRLQMLSLLTGTQLSAAEIARELAITHANASYHLRFLAAAGLVVEAGEEKIRGGTAKRYRHPWDAATLSSTRSSRAENEEYIAAVAAELVRRYQLKHPGTSAFTTDAELWVAPETWDEVCALVTQASHLVHREARPPRSPGTLHVNLTAAAFQMGERDSRADVRPKEDQ